MADGRLHGVGAADCKGGLAAQVFAGAVLKESLLPLRGNLVVAATVAEKNGLSVGVQGFIEKTLPELELEPSFAILGEPTGLGLYYGHDGWVEIEVNIQGANPFQVDDAAGAIYRDFGAIAEADAQAAGHDLEMVAVRPPRYGRDWGLRRATIAMDRRLRMNEDVDEIVSNVRHNACLVAQACGPVTVNVAVREEEQRLYNGVTTVTRRVANAWATDPFHPLMDRARQTLVAAGCEARPGKWRLGRLGMGTAGGVLVEKYAVPTIGYGPGLETVAHARDEYVDVDKVGEALYGAVAIVHGLIGVPVFGWTSEDI